MYLRLAYTSRSTVTMGASDVFDIIRSANNRNSTLGLTGGLLYADGYFAQVLEGAPYAVMNRFERIAKDARHEDIQLRYQAKTSSLMFPNDWMALRDISQIPPENLRRFGYEKGLPENNFSGEKLIEFLQACFEVANTI